MATGAQVRRFDPEESRAWVLDVMDAVTICTDRDIGVIFLDQGAAMDARFILLIDLIVALSAGSRNQ